MTLLRINADIIIDSDHASQAVCETLLAGATDALGGFPLGEVVAFDVLSQDKVQDAEADERGWTE